jgi:hypothetical protein
LHGSALSLQSAKKRNYTDKAHLQKNVSAAWHGSPLSLQSVKKKDSKKYQKKIAKKKCLRRHSRTLSLSVAYQWRRQ